MRLVTFRSKDGSDRLGALIDNDEAVVDLHAARTETAFNSMLALMEAGHDALQGARKLVADPPSAAVLETSKISLQTPLPRPPQVRDFLCFEDHLKQSYKLLRRNRAALEPDPEAALKRFEAQGLFRIPDIFYQQPIYYKANRLAVIGPDQNVLWPDYAEDMDFELEFGFFVGKRGKNIARDNARSHIFGYSIFNDISARDAQAIEMPGGLGPGKGKDFDTSNVIGPCIVTADELDPYDCTMIARINGEEWSRGHSGSIHWTFEDVIAHISRSETIFPGEFFGSGTVGGGCGLELEKYLSDGDVIELEVEGIGILRNRIIRE
ncbi:MAG: fumarylacetoacetate hydrolase family protein [Pseudomonadota bacterium]|nr:fumarylacetoacetate hydrolase family protein [Pseudomonadota bacterium]